MIPTTVLGRMTEDELDEIERRAAAAGPGERLRPMRDAERAGEGVAVFVAHARANVLRLVTAV